MIVNCDSECDYYYVYVFNNFVNIFDYVYNEKFCMFFVLEIGYYLMLLLVWLYDICFVMIYIFSFIVIKV